MILQLKSSVGRRPTSVCCCHITTEFPLKKIFSTLEGSFVPKMYKLVDKQYYTYICCNLIQYLQIAKGTSHVEVSWYTASHIYMDQTSLQNASHKVQVLQYIRTPRSCSVSAADEIISRSAIQKDSIFQYCHWTSDYVNKQRSSF